MIVIRQSKLTHYKIYLKQGEILPSRAKRKVDIGTIISATGRPN